jgi:hypothetical protein
MAADFPASHSQDTIWFAVDANGHVAVLDSGENGHVAAGAPDADASNVLGDLAYGPPGEPWPSDRAQARRGLFVYDYDERDDPIWPYKRRAVPDAPLHVDQLPPEVRELLKRARFDGVDFSQSERFQPLEFVECVFCYQGERAAYLCADGRTVRPIPGAEDRFGEFCEALRARDPEAARAWRFEGPRAGA